MGVATWIGAGLASLLALCACKEQSAFERYQSQAPIDPPSLWSVAVVERGVETAKVTICADRGLRAGFTTPLPMSDGRACALIGPAVTTPEQARMRCALEGRAFDVRAFTRGDPAKDFSVDFRMRSLDAERLVLRQTRHYVLLGVCPAGWGVGDNTDRFGRRRLNALR